MVVGKQRLLVSGQVSTVTRKGILAEATALKAQGLECGQHVQQGARRIMRLQQSDWVKCRLRV